MKTMVKKAFVMDRLNRLRLNESSSHAYFPKDKDAGLRKLNRAQTYLAWTPYVQQRLKIIIATCLKKVLQTRYLNLLVKPNHYGVAIKGVDQMPSSTVTKCLAAVLNMVTGTSFYTVTGESNRLLPI
jgi:GTP cyclohydrolase I